MMEEAQDFSMKSNKPQQQQQTQQQQSSEHAQHNKSKLDDMLSKLMQRKNCVSINLYPNNYLIYYYCIKLFKHLECDKAALKKKL
jgi:molybdopterin-biosynthesis enzyme MoeA-like protein